MRCTEWRNLIRSQTGGKKTPSTRPEARACFYNSLHDRGYPSIGYKPGTRVIQPGEDVRAGGR